MPKKQAAISFRYTKAFKILIGGVWRDNPIFCMILGICSALAITNKVANAVAMGLGVTFVIVVSSAIVSAIRNIIPSRVRMLTYMITIATFVICVDRFLKAFFPAISKSMGPYVGLIITNCIVMGRCESFAIKSSVRHSLLDGLSCGIGYSYILLLVASVREVMAFGTFLGLRVMPLGWTDWTVMAIAPGAFFLLGIYLWIFRTLLGKTET